MKQQKVYLVYRQSYYTSKDRNIENSLPFDEMCMDIFKNKRDAEMYLERFKKWEIERGKKIEIENTNKEQFVSKWIDNYGTKWRKLVQIIERYIR